MKKIAVLILYLLIFVFELSAIKRDSKDGQFILSEALTTYMESYRSDSAHTQVYDRTVFRLDSLLHLKDYDMEVCAQSLFDVSETLRTDKKNKEVIELYSLTLPVIEQYFDVSESIRRILIFSYDNWGCVYQNMGLKNQGLVLYSKALSMAKRSNLMVEQAILYNNIASYNMLHDNYSVADSLLNLAIAINEDIDNKDNLFINYNNLSAIYSRQQLYDKALEYAFMALHQLDENKQSDLQMLMFANIGSVYMNRNELSMALSYLYRVKSYQQKNNQKYYLINTYRILATIKNMAFQKDSALFYVNEARQLAEMFKDVEDNSRLLNLESKIHLQNGDYKKAYNSYEQSVRLRDSIRTRDTEIQIESMNNMYEDLQHQHQQLLDMRSVHTSLWHNVFLIVLGSLLIIALIIFIAIRKYRQARLEYFGTMRAYSRERQQLMSELEGKLTVLSQEKLQSDVQLDDERQRMTSLSLRSMKNEEALQVITEELKTLLLEINPKDTEKKEHIKYIQSRLGLLQKGTNWDEYSYYFEKVNHSFFDRLKVVAPLLTVKEQRLCALLHLGLSTKEIAEITFKESRSVDSARNRLKKKLSIDGDLAQFLINL